MSKYYAIAKGRNVENVIVRSWEECRTLTNGYNSVFKSFKTEPEALAYLEDINVPDTQKKMSKNIAYKKRIRETTVQIKGRIPKSINEKLEDKCASQEITIEQVLNKLILEWVE